MKIALVTDTHFGARSDSQPFDAFFKKFYSEIFFPELDKRGITNVIHLGDCFDRRKYINFNSLKSQSKIKVSSDEVFQFYSEKKLLDSFARDGTIVYEDMILWEEVAQSKYKKNQYPVSFDQLFDNYKDLEKLFNGQ